MNCNTMQKCIALPHLCRVGCWLSRCSGNDIKHRPRSTVNTRGTKLNLPSNTFHAKRLKGCPKWCGGEWETDWIDHPPTGGANGLPISTRPNNQLELESAPWHSSAECRVQHFGEELNNSYSVPWDPLKSYVYSTLLSRTDPEDPQL